MNDKFWQIVGLVLMFSGALTIVVGVPLFYLFDLLMNSQAIVLHR